MNHVTRSLTISLLCCLLLAACAPTIPAATLTLVPPTDTSIPLANNTTVPHKDTSLPLTAATINPSPEPTEDVVSKIDQGLSFFTKQEVFTGAVLVARDGEVLLSQGYSLADRDKNIPNTPQTRFRLNSLTKQFTAMAILVLQKEGRLNVENPICRYISECPAAWQEITIHHLLTHTSGITDFSSLPDFDAKKGSPSTPLETMARFKDLPLDFKPGKNWSYSNSGYIVLGYIIEQASGQSYESFLQQSIFDPLQMKNTGYDHNDGSLAIGYTNVYSHWEKAAYIDMSLPYAAGALYSTVEDLYLWDQALYTEQLLPKELMDLMFSAQAKIPNRNLSYGYGWFVGESNHRQVAFHGGGPYGGFVAEIDRYPADKVTIIVLSNRDAKGIVDVINLISKYLFEE